MILKYKVSKESYELMQRLRDRCQSILVRNFELALGESPYTIGDFMQVFAYMGMNGYYAEHAVAEMTTGIQKPGRGKSCGVPSADTVLGCLAEKDYTEIVDEATTAIKEIVKRASKSGAFEDEIDAAIDTHNVYRYSKKMFKLRKKEADDLKFIKGTKAKNSASYAHQYLTVHTINARENYTLCFEPVKPLDNMVDCTEKAIRQGEESLGKAIRGTYIDCGGYSARMMLLHERLRKKYVIRAPKDDRILKIIEKSRGLWCWLEPDYELTDGKNTAKTNIVVVDVEALRARKHDYPLIKEKEKYLSFATNHLPEEGESILDFCIRIAVDYKGRWAIETSYREQNHFHAKTHSLHYSVRLFLFALSVILYDLFQLIPMLMRQNKTFMAMYGGKKKMTKQMFSFMVSIMCLEAIGFINVNFK